MHNDRGLTSHLRQTWRTQVHHEKVTNRADGRWLTRGWWPWGTRRKKTRRKGYEENIGEGEGGLVRRLHGCKKLMQMPPGGERTRATIFFSATVRGRNVQEVITKRSPWRHLHLEHRRGAVPAAQGEFADVIASPLTVRRDLYISRIPRTPKWYKYEFVWWRKTDKKVHKSTYKMSRSVETIECKLTFCWRPTVSSTTRRIAENT